MELIILIAVIILPLSLAVTGALRDFVLYPGIILSLTLRFIPVEINLISLFIPLAIYFLLKIACRKKSYTKNLDSDIPFDAGFIERGIKNYNRTKSENVVLGKCLMKFEYRIK